MSERGEGAAVVAVGAATCAACCAGPLLGVITAIGIGAAAGAWLFGTVGLEIAAVIAATLLIRRRRQRCAPIAETIDVAPPRVRAP